MKAVLISIKPKWCELIANGKKTVEVRKTKPKIDVPFKVYIYCTQAQGKNDYLNLNAFGYDLECKPISEFTLNGNKKVIGEFICMGIMQPIDNFKLLSKLSCVPMEELYEYSNGKQLYGWRIHNFVIYDKPKELGEFSVYEKPDCTAYLKGICLNVTRTEFPSCTDVDCDYRKLKRPPQSWQFVEELGE